MADKQIIRTSDRGRFKKCRQQWDFESPMRQGYRYAGGVKPLDFGIAMHVGLEIYYDPERWSYPKEIREKLAIRAFLDSCEEQKAKVMLATPDLSVETEADFKERGELGVAMLEHYFSWSEERDTFKPIKSEIEFEVPIPGMDAVYQGRIDLIIEDAQGDYWIVDHKTAAQFGDTTHLDLDVQVGSYCWAIQKQLGIPVKGVIYNELRKSVPQEPVVNKNGTISRNKAQRTTATLYRQKIAELGLREIDYAEILEHLEKNQNYFRRTVLFRSSAELEVVEKIIQLEAKDMLDPDVSIYPNPTKFNCGWCSFFAPCLATMDGSDPTWLLEDSGRYAKN